MLLFLDDDPNRAAITYQRMSPEERQKTIWCQTVEETIVTLRDYKDELEVVMLDHDLGGQTYVNSKREDCGMEVIRYLEKYQNENPKEFEAFVDVNFIVHTYNTYAGHKMVERLQKLGINRVVYQPFGT